MCNTCPKTPCSSEQQCFESIALNEVEVYESTTGRNVANAEATCSYEQKETSFVGIPLGKSIRSLGVCILIYACCIRGTGCVLTW